MGYVARLAIIRRNVEKYLTDTCALMQVQHVSSGDGNWTDQLLPIPGGEQVACRIDRPNHKEREMLADRVVADRELYRLFLPWNVAVADNMKVVHKTITYDIQAISDDLTDAVYKIAYITRSV